MKPRKNQIKKLLKRYERAYYHGPRAYTAFILLDLIMKITGQDTPF